MLTLWILSVLSISLGLGYLFYKKSKKSNVYNSFPTTWKTILEQKVQFYKNLNNAEKARFEDDVIRFLNQVAISGAKVEVDIEDKLLVASSAVIPVFGFPDWEYTYLNEVILYPKSFDRNFQLGNEEEIVTGMVGNGIMEGKMILSKPSLHSGFSNDRDKKNVGIHEFIHLFDKEDGSVDGVPPTLQGHASALPWLDLIRQKTKEILEEESDINPYGATNDQEFLAVAGEYFFERPHLLQDKHPELYNVLAKVFNQDTTKILNETATKRPEIGRNSPCPCGSGKKFKKCCMIK